MRPSGSCALRFLTQLTDQFIGVDVSTKAASIKDKFTLDLTRHVVN